MTTWVSRCTEGRGERRTGWLGVGDVVLVSVSVVAVFVVVAVICDGRCCSHIVTVVVASAIVVVVSVMVVMVVVSVIVVVVSVMIVVVVLLAMVVGLS